MLEVVVQLFGGIGLFLIGMSLMTDGLKEMAGDTLRIWLSKFTGSTFKAICSGVGLTLIVQSSTATTLATIGFVSAGILTLTQAIGVVIGANIGTTSTGWIVALLGVKFSITNIALPLIGFGAILKLLMPGRWSLFGLSIAGFGLIFFGIDLLQVAMSGFAEHVDLSIFSNDRLSTQLILVLVGIVMTVILQSSSAAITATIAALASGAIDFQQAILLVIGQNIGTVATAILAAIGSTINAKRTAFVHVMFNVVSALFAFILLRPLFVWIYQHDTLVSQWDDVIVVAAFHTAFSLMGALIFIPLMKPFEQIIIKLIPDKTPSILHYLDRSSLSVPTLAISAASKVIHHSILSALGMLNQAIQEAVLPSNMNLKQLDDAIHGVQFYLEQMPVSENQVDQVRLVELLRLMVYLRVLRSDLSHVNFAVEIRIQPAIYQIGLDYSYVLQQYLIEGVVLNDADKMNNLSQEMLYLKKWTEDQNLEIRNSILEYVSLNHLNAAKGLELLAAQRWLARTIAHTQRLANVLYENAQKTETKTNYENMSQV